MNPDNIASTPKGGSSLLYLPGEPLFGAVAVQCLKHGWTLIPQERGERRGTSLIDGRALKWGQYNDTPPTPEEVQHWAYQAPTSNAAILLGPPSNNVFCFDIDVLDEDLNYEIQGLADDILGPTRFTREGQAPKIALFYRAESVDMLPPNRSFRFMAADLINVSGDAIEIQGRGRMVTAYGYHHKTDRYFRWEGPQPYTYKSTDVPLVTPEQVEDFISAIQDVRPFHRNAGINLTNVTWDSVETEGVIIPKLRADSGNTSWVEDPDTGLVIDGREAFLWMLSRQTARMNAAACRTPQGEANVKKKVFDEFKLRARMSDKWTDHYLKVEIDDKVGRAARDIREGRLTEYHERQKRDLIPVEKREKSAPIISEASNDKALSFLPPVPGSKEVTQKTRFRSDTSPYAFISDKDENAYEQRRLQPDRSEIAARVQASLTDALDEFFSEVYDEEKRDEIKPIHVLKAPTGAGKTTRTIRYIAEDVRTKKWDEAIARGEESPGPILFLLPTYNNIDELRVRAEVLNLDSSLSDEDLGEQALELGIVAADNLETALSDLRRDAMNAGLKTMVYKGKIAAGCQMENKVRMLMDAGIGTSGLCKAKVTNKDGETEERTCIHYATCPAIKQRKQIQESHVVFLPHAFLTLNIPEELKTVRAVIADERIFPLFVHTATFYLNTLERARREPRLTRKEREAGLSPLDLLQDRERAAEIAKGALLDGRCPAQALFEYRKKPKKSTDRVVTGADLVRSALRVCGSAISSNAMINPDMSDSEIKDLCSRPTGTEVSEEYRFWKIIDERIEMLMTADLPGSSLNPFVKKPCGNREMRIQALKEEDANGHRSELIRISWRSEPNWSGAPLLLLDASAAPKIISKLFGERTVRVHDIDAPLNVRTVLLVDKTYSNSAIVAKIGGHPERMRSAKLKDKCQRVLSACSSLFGYGRVVCGASIAVRKAMNTDWMAPSNVDFCHFGATRGLDFAKFHSAAVSFGRMEVPTRTIDGIVAALTYDDECPEEPFDRNGDGLAPDGKALQLPTEGLTVPLRSGQDAVINIPFYPGEWAKTVQKQYREEELRQFVGRLRPVYREGDAPVWIAVSRVIPDGIIVDEIATIDDLVKKNGKSIEIWNAVRMSDGVLASDLLHEATPWINSSVEDWQSEVAKMGFDEQTGILDPKDRTVWGFTPARIKDDAGERYVFVRSDIRDPAQAIMDSFARHLGIMVDIIEVGTPVHQRRPGVQRDNDWVSNDLGDTEKRRRDEINGILNSAVHAIRVSSKDAFRTMGNNRLPRFVNYEFKKEDKIETLLMTLGELTAGLATERMWEGTDMAVSSPVIDPSQNFEEMGDGAFDEDDM